MRIRATPSTLFLAFLTGGLGVYALHMLAGFGGHRLDGFFADVVYNLLVLGAAGAFLTRGVRVEAQRAAWLRDWRAACAPALLLVAALGVLVYADVGHHELPPAALVLAAVTALTAGARLAITVRASLATLVSMRELALTDPLTGLGNRRLLIEDLRVVCRLAREGERWELVLYDLNGFKRYNDTFGHPAGDTMLARLSGRLSEAVSSCGTAYRMGGDEFCVLFRSAGADSEALIAASLGALSEQGAGFAIDAAHGVVRIPGEAQEPSATMLLADQRLYRRKDLSREGAVAHRPREAEDVEERRDPRAAQSAAEAQGAPAPARATPAQATLSI